MAAMRCPVHGHVDNSTSTICWCLEPLVPDEPATVPGAAAPATCPEPGCGMPLAAGGRCPVHAIGAPHADPGLGGPLALRFPWGTVEVGPDGLRVGRSAGTGPLADRITETDYHNVSRQHAVLWRDGRRLYLRDVGSTNGTFVNDRRLPDHTPHELQVGDVLRFAANLSASVVAAPADLPTAP